MKITLNGQENEMLPRSPISNGNIAEFAHSTSHTKKNIKVAFFADILLKDFDGAIKTMYQLIHRIPDEKTEYAFFTGILPKHSFQHQAIKVPSVGIPLNNTYKIAFPQFRKKRLSQALSQFKPDVIHLATPSFLGFWGLSYAKKHKIPALSIYHTHFISYVRYYFMRTPFLIKPVEWFVKKMYKRFYNQCDVVYAPTLKIKEELESYGISHKVLKLWQRGLDAHLFNPSQKDAGYMKETTGNDKPCILFASRLVWEKNMETLFGIYDALEAEGIDVNFVVAGTGVAEETARQRMKKAIFLGFLPHEKLAKVYASCDVFVFTSVSESYGNVVVEAMACGCVPVIARGGGSQTLIKDGKTGFLCDPNKPIDYVTKINLLLSDTKRKQKMQQAGYKYVAPLSWDRLAEEYFNDIETLHSTAKSEKERKRILFPPFSQPEKRVLQSMPSGI